MDKRVGRDVTAKLAGVSPLSRDELTSFSSQLNQKFASLFLPSEQSWYHPPWFKHFKAVDTDGSGRISFDEFREMLRGSLQMSRKELPESRLQQAWKALDEDESGWVSTGEWGRFMKIGRPPPPVPAKERMLQERIAAFAQQRAEQERRVGSDLNAKFKSIPAASDDEVKHLSERFNKALSNGRENLQWYELFKRVDTDRSGRISYEEFAEMVRRELEISVVQLPNARLRGLWKALDEDASGFISAGEFGRFMRCTQAVPYEVAVEKYEARREVLRANKIQQVISSQAEVDHHAQLRRETAMAEAAAKQLQQEAMRLEAELAKRGHQRRVGFFDSLAQRKAEPPKSTPRRPPGRPNGSRQVQTLQLGPPAATATASGGMGAVEAFFKSNRPRFVDSRRQDGLFDDDDDDDDDDGSVFSMSKI